jgi:hypothetical protein
MKNLLLALFLFISSQSYSQVLKLDVKNSGNCTRYFTIVCSVIGTTPTCTIGAVSTVIAIPPGGAINYGPGTVPGVTGYRHILAVNILHGPPACGLGSTTIGDTGCSYTTSASGVPNATPGCQNCPSTNAAWTPLVIPNGSARVDF